MWQFNSFVHSFFLRPNHNEKNSVCVCVPLLQVLLLLAPMHSDYYQQIQQSGNSFDSKIVKLLLTFSSFANPKRASQWNIHVFFSSVFYGVVGVVVFCCWWDVSCNDIGVLQHLLLFCCRCRCCRFAKFMRTLLRHFAALFTVTEIVEPESEFFILNLIAIIVVIIHRHQHQHHRHYHCETLWYCN